MSNVHEETDRDIIDLEANKCSKEHSIWSQQGLSQLSLSQSEKESITGGSSKSISESYLSKDSTNIKIIDFGTAKLSLPGEQVK